MTYKIRYNSVKNISDKNRYVLEVFSEFKEVFEDDLSDCSIIELIHETYNKKNNISTN